MDWKQNYRRKTTTSKLPPRQHNQKGTTENRETNPTNGIDYPSLPHQHTLWKLSHVSFSRFSTNETSKNTVFSNERKLKIYINATGMKLNKTTTTKKSHLQHRMLLLTRLHRQNIKLTRHTYRWKQNITKEARWEIRLLGPHQRKTHITKLNRKTQKHFSNQVDDKKRKLVPAIQIQRQQKNRDNGHFKHNAYDELVALQQKYIYNDSLLYFYFKTIHTSFRHYTCTLSFPCYTLLHYLTDLSQTNKTRLCRNWFLYRIQILHWFVVESIHPYKLRTLTFSIYRIYRI